MKGEKLSRAYDMGMVGNMEEIRDWSELPHDIVGHIIGKLYWPDRIRVRAVCKNWLGVSVDGIPTMNKGAWVMAYRWVRPRKPGFSIYIDQPKPKPEDKVRSTCLLIDYRVSRTNYHIDRGGELKREDERGIFVEASFQSSKYGWALFKKHEEENPSRCCCFFLFSPFTDEVVELPELELNSPIWSRSLVATFNLSWTSSDCLVFCVRRDYNGTEGTIHISTCRPSDKTWKTLELQFELGCLNRPLAATYVAATGCFYCVFARGHLGAFNVALQEWTLLANSWPIWQESEEEEEQRTLTLTSSTICDYAELFALPRCSGRPSYKNCCKSKLVKFDFLNKCWVEVDKILSIGEEMINNNDTHLYAYLPLYPGLLLRPYDITPVEFVLIEPPLKGVWKKSDLLHP
ncbi:hypothetical protein CCACVL1_16339 [Corchorus capsularis]|uniref:KIB1-4 beta-propeller domain-containing protein n=1 Tax=Corchorus capsularis TaxID=210143 RepID=A0A1R3HY03_COCAP|nr:hypothetical protein CCACVL1_16339 [Corchorus capsularis]